MNRDLNNEKKGTCKDVFGKSVRMCKGPRVGKGVAYLEKGKKAGVFGEW